MHLREVVLRNWRSYRSATFRFPAPTQARRVLLVGAMNGTGKTSLLVALYLGLFGREAMQFVEGVKLGSSDDEKIRSYKQLIQRILHRPALDGEDPHASVQLLFEDGRRSVTIIRTWHYTRGGVPRDLSVGGEGEEVRVVLDGRVVRVADWQDANNKIAAELFPYHVMPCFFFDGEQAQERVEASGAAALSEAMKVLYGTGLIDELGRSLKQYIDSEKSSAKRDVGELNVDVLDAKRRRRDEIDDEVASIGRDLSRLRADIESAEASRKQKLVELTQWTGDATVDLKQMAEKKAGLESDERELSDRLRESLAQLALPTALAKFGEAVLAQLQGELDRDRWSLLRDETMAKVDQIVANAVPTPGNADLQPPLTTEQYQRLVQRLRTSLEALWHPPPPGCAESFKYAFLGSSDRAAVQSRIRTALAADGQDIGAMANDWESLRARVRDANRQWDAMADVKPRIESLKTSLTDIDDRMRELHTRRAHLEGRERGLDSERKDLLASIAQMESAKRKLGPVQQKLDLAERVRSVISDVRERLMPLCKKSLEERCTVHFREMISPEYRRHTIEFDHDLQPVLVGGPTPIYVTTLSGVQKRVFGLAFTLAVAEVSGEDAPLVIDTPVGNADSEYRTRMLVYLARVATGQVIFLSHDEEICGPYEKAIEPYVLRKYLVTFEPVADGAGVSAVQEGVYFPPAPGRAVA